MVVFDRVYKSPERTLIKLATALLRNREVLNPFPKVFAQQSISRDTDRDDNEREGIDQLDVFDLIRDINDPEHPLTLEQLNVVQYELIKVDDTGSAVDINFTPTIPHCSMATLIGLSIRVKLLRSLPNRFKVDIRVTPGTHASEVAVNRQLNDKERVAAALENTHLIEVVNRCLSRSVS
mmetsp:Transcript_24176/g.39719  ORF Transcript_24176/g.39719 Transcript_24176/m.39719 type:complete len:179 (+) Transcript_24176:1873-2409(+)